MLIQAVAHVHGEPALPGSKTHPPFSNVGVHFRQRAHAPRSLRAPHHTQETLPTNLCTRTHSLLAKQAACRHTNKPNHLIKIIRPHLIKENTLLFSFEKTCFLLPFCCHTRLQHQGTRRKPTTQLHDSAGFFRIPRTTKNHPNRLITRRPQVQILTPLPS